jgi:hypothetical protein
MATPTRDEPKPANAPEELKGAANEPGSLAATAQWNLPTRLAFRFCFAYFTLYCVMNQVLLVPVPGSDGPDIGVRWPMRQITLWTAAHLFHSTPSLPSTGGGDTAYDWIQVFCILAIAVVATVVWSVLDRRRPNYVTLHKWFRVFVRFALAEMMFSYGFAKVFLKQMRFPPLKMLVQPFGEFNNHAVLWNSIGAAPVYEIFAGSAEVLGGLLLIFPATATLGALVCLADMTQVFTLDLAYDIDAKLFAFHLLLLAVLLLAPDAQRLFGFFLANRTTPPSTRPPLFRTARACRIALVLLALLGFYQIGVYAYDFSYGAWVSFDRAVLANPLRGIWNVDEMSIDSQPRPPLLTDTERWRRVIFGAYSANDVVFQRCDDTFLYYGSSEKAHELLLKDAGPVPEWGYLGNGNRSGNFTIDRPTPDNLILDGTLGEHKIHAVLKKMDLNQFPLVKGGFHWVSQ